MEKMKDKLLIYIYMSSLNIIVLTLRNKTYLNSFVRNNSPVSSLYTSWASSVIGFISFLSLQPVVEGINQ